MRLLLHDSLATLPLTVPIRSGWVERGDVEIVFDDDLVAASVRPDDVALIPAGELCGLTDRFQVVPDIGVIADSEGPISLRVPVRPDEVAATPVTLLGTGSTAEILARAVLRPFFGIEATRWTHEPDPEAQAIVVEGETALIPPEGGYAEDLCRAWFILTGQATVLNVLIAPLGAERPALEPVLRVLNAATTAIDKAQRREIRRPVAERLGLGTEAVNAFFERLFFSLEADDEASLTEMLRRGVPGSRFPAPGPITFMDPLPGSRPEDTASDEPDDDEP